MANYYSDHPEIEFHLNHPLMKRVVDLKERNYAEKDQFEDAPVYPGGLLKKAITVYPYKTYKYTESGGDIVAL